MSWHLGRMAGFDLETTAADPETARIVTACIVQVGGQQPPQPATWVADPGVEIPEEAAKIHGYTTERARKEGRPAPEVVEDIAATLAVAFSEARAALVVMNVPFDLSLLNAECARHGVRPLGERVGGLFPVVDPLVLDRAADKYRKGKRTLEALTAEYGVTLNGAHTADADAQAALDVARAIAEAYPSLQVPARILHGWQAHWHQAWAADFQAYLRGKGQRDAVIDGSWPLRPVGGAE